MVKYQNDVVERSWGWRAFVFLLLFSPIVLKDVGEKSKYHQQVLQFLQAGHILGRSEKKKSLGCVAPGLSLELSWRKKKKKKKEQSSTSMSGDSHFLEADCSMLRHVHRKMTDALEIDGWQSGETKAQIPEEQNG